MAMPWPAMSGALPWMGSYRPGTVPSEAVPGRPARLAEGSMPSEPDRTAASSEMMSPKVFSATITS